MRAGPRHFTPPALHSAPCSDRPPSSTASSPETFPWIPLRPPPCEHRDALEACGGLFGEARDDCLAVFGIDAARTDSYYTAVSALEAALERDTEPEEEASHRGQERC